MRSRDLLYHRMDAMTPDLRRLLVSFVGTRGIGRVAPLNRLWNQTAVEIRDQQMQRGRAVVAWLRTLPQDPYESTYSRPSGILPTLVALLKPVAPNPMQYGGRGCTPETVREQGYGFTHEEVRMLSAPAVEWSEMLLLLGQESFCNLAELKAALVVDEDGAELAQTEWVERMTPQYEWLPLVASQSFHLRTYLEVIPFANKSTENRRLLEGCLRANWEVYPPHHKRDDGYRNLVFAEGKYPHWGGLAEKAAYREAVGPWQARLLAGTLPHQLVPGLGEGERSYDRGASGWVRPNLTYFGDMLAAELWTRHRLVFLDAFQLPAVRDLLMVEYPYGSIGHVLDEIVKIVREQ